MTIDTAAKYILANGLISNSAISINQNLIDTVNSFTEDNISGAVQGYLEKLRSTNDTSTVDQAVEILGNLPVCLSGIDSGHETTNLPLSVLDQARSYFRTESTGNNIRVGAFLPVFTQVSGYLSQIYSIYRVENILKNKTFDDYGFQYKNHMDLATGGITNQFDKNYISDLAKELPNFGDMYNVSDLSKINDYGSLINNLIDRGLGYVGNLSSKVDNIDLDIIDDSNRCHLEEICKGISGNELEEIMNVTNFKPANKDKIKTLDDVLKIENVLSDNAMKALGNTPTFDDLSRKLSNIGGRFNNASELGNFYSKIIVDDLPNLEVLPKPAPTNLSLPNLGQGSGLENNPSIDEVLGSVSGKFYADRLTKIINIQVAIADNVDIVELVEHLEDSESFDESTLTQLVNQVKNNVELAKYFSQGDILMQECSNRFGLELDNISKSGVIIGATELNTIGLINFANSVSSLVIDEKSIGYYDFLRNVATDNIYGEALKMTLIEARNLKEMSSVGIKTGTKIDK